MLDSVDYFGFKILCYNKLVYFVFKGRRAVGLTVTVTVHKQLIYYNYCNIYIYSFSSYYIQ